MEFLCLYEKQDIIKKRKTAEKITKWTQKKRTEDTPLEKIEKRMRKKNRKNQRKNRTDMGNRTNAKNKLKRTRETTKRKANCKRNRKEKN